MSKLLAVPTPSTALLRFLRSQTAIFESSDCLSRAPRSCRANTKTRTHLQQRSLSNSSKCSYANPRSYIDDIFSKNRQACKALPAPRPQPLSQHYGSPRSASTDTSPQQLEKPSLWRRLWYRKRMRNRAAQSDQVDYPISANGSYEETSAQLFNLSRALSRNPSGTELKLRCTEFDKSGSVTMVSGEFKKSELIAKYGLLPRDLRKIDSSILPHILVRPSAILINLLHLRVLIQSDRVLVFDAYGSTDSYTQSLFMYDLEGKLRQKQVTNDGSVKDKDGHNTITYMPYEFRALEAVLISVTSGLEAEFALVREPVTNILRALEDSIDREKLRHLLIHSKKLGTFEQKARLVRDSLDELLEADDDLATMYLSERKKTGKPRAVDDHQEVEMLLESYHKICDEVVEISGNLISNIRNTEEVTKAILDANRNELMLFEIKVSIVTLGIAGGTLVAGLYGMNLENFIEHSNIGFPAITAMCLVLSAWTARIGLRWLRKAQQVRMWGDIDADPVAIRQKYLRSHGQGSPMLSRPEMRPEFGKGNWRSEFEKEALKQKEQNLKRFGGYSTGSTNTAGAGPVLWPGMQGLKLSGEVGVEYEPTNSDSDDSGPNPRLQKATTPPDAPPVPAVPSVGTTSTSSRK